MVLGLTLATLLGLALAAEAAGIDPASYLQPQVNAPTYHVNDIWTKHTHLPNFAEITRCAGDTFNVLPKEYDPAFKNPCWNDGTAFKCLPYFQILGVSKCGTTDLYNRLKEHRDMVDCSWKGPHFWDESAFPTHQHRPGKYDGSFPAYVNIFDKPAERIKANKNAITGEASSNTFTGVFSHLRGRTLAKRTNATLAQYLFEATPWARYIVLMRDPVTRYRSAYFYYRSKKLPRASDKEFLEKVIDDTNKWKDCVKEFGGHHHCLMQYEPQQLVKGMYAEFIPGWLEVFPRDRFLFMRTEDYKAAPVEHVVATMKFLGLSDLTPAEVEEIRKLEAKNSQAQKYNDATNESQELATAFRLLRDFYRPFNQALSKFFDNDPRWLWGY
ncbi:hypothetical protein HYH03_011429 [Edaphochlamys debaryana]|uniref:Sulfotransferase n=1 Tax=Edaphochlamys debaryana TaxID=47281 RepID=A0A836BWG5_9CHLO|nr:hypothetical protein HYH03_011429 [Edaphochlamys debaryana]|eukprot:KAG2490123.1 hypothetical protein HYH03_011429 [Edaphochlamys debaryana]